MVSYVGALNVMLLLLFLFSAEVEVEAGQHGTSLPTAERIESTSWPLLETKIMPE
jgi:hypothetical protein